MTKRILVCSSTFPLGPADRRTAPFVYKLAQALAMRYAVTALAPHHGGAAIRETLGGVEVRRFKYFLPTSFQKLADGAGIMPRLRTSWWAWGQVPPFLAAFRAAAGRQIRNGGFTAVNSHWIIPSAWAAGRPAARYNVPHLVSVHAADVFLLKRLPRGRGLATDLLRNARAVFGDSRFILDQTNELVGFDVGGVATTTGVDAAAFAPRVSSSQAKETLGWPAAPALLFVGRMVEKKGLPYLIDAFALARRTCTDLRLVLVGEGPERAAAEKRARDRGVADGVQFVGPRGYGELPIYYNAADALVVPSIVDRTGETEGMPTVILEAFAAACPVVGSDVAGIPEFVRNGETGYLARAADAEELAGRIVQVIAAGKESFKEPCLATAAAHTFEAIAARYAEAIEGH